MRQVKVSTLKLLGGHVVLDFTNTVESRGARYGPDVLRSYGDLLDWGVRLKVLDTSEATAIRDLLVKPGEDTLARAKALREALYRIFAAPVSANAVDLDLLQREVREAQAKRLLVPGCDHFAWRWVDADPDAVTHRVALLAIDLLTSAALGRVHVCPGENCAWLFLDASRSGRRLWCSEETCGRRDRIRRWRAVQRDKRDGSK
jgi:predicted RNA-binding Zn ribbon-like protein